MKTKYKFTVSDYIAAISRELSKRETTYPKLLKKLEKQGKADDIPKEAKKFSDQSETLAACLKVIRDAPPLFDPTSAEIMHQELQRELKMRKRVYPRMIFFKRITQETADYELAIWAELTERFYEKYLNY